MAELVVVIVLHDHEYDAYLAWERQQDSFAFHRVDERKTILKRRCDCGHWIDGTEPYRYQVWKLNRDTTISQRLDCEPCARRDASY